MTEEEDEQGHGEYEVKELSVDLQSLSEQGDGTSEIGDKALVTPRSETSASHVTPPNSPMSRESSDKPSYWSENADVVRQRTTSEAQTTDETDQLAPEWLQKAENVLDMNPSEVSSVVIPAASESLSDRVDKLESTMLRMEALVTSLRDTLTARTRQARQIPVVKTQAPSTVQPSMATQRTKARTLGFL